MIGVYVHVPFCIRKCPYCDFYSLPFEDELADVYTEAVIRAMRTHPYGRIQADTLYFGGGTPVLLGHARLGKILSAARDVFGIDETCEITLEANPTASMRDDLVRLRGLGFNRVSIGVQSLIDDELLALGRLHDAKTARRAVLDAAQAGFENISADLMLAVPGQTEDTLARSIDALAALPVNHISAYLLKIEEDTPFFAQKEALALPDEEAAAELYFDCLYFLGTQGFLQYEISNFARDGLVSRHNLKYWRCEEYLGFGPGAHSFLAGKRFYFPRELDRFVRSALPFELAVADGAGGSFEELAMLRLRLTEGLTLGGTSLGKQDVGAMLSKAREYERHGLVRVLGDNISLTPEGFLLSNSVITGLLAVTDPGYCAVGGRSHR